MLPVLFAGDSIAMEAAAMLPGSRCVAVGGTGFCDVEEQLRGVAAIDGGSPVRLIIISAGANDGVKMLQRARDSVQGIVQQCLHLCSSASICFLRPGWSTANGMGLVSHETAVFLQDYGFVGDLDEASPYELGATPRRRGGPPLRRHLHYLAANGGDADDFLRAQIHAVVKKLCNQ